MELYRALECNNYIDETPTIKLAIYNSRRGWVDVEAPIDTGYSGALLLPNRMYFDIIEFEYPVNTFPVYRTLRGDIIMRRGIALIKVFDREFEAYIETPMYGEGKLLVGRKLLNKLDIGLLGSKREICLLKGEKSLENEV